MRDISLGSGIFQGSLVLTFRELSNRLLEMLEPTHHISETSGGPKVLLLQTKFLSNYHPRKSKYSILVYSERGEDEQVV